MSNWRYVQNGQPSAPVDTPALQALLTSGALSLDTLVWRDGMTNWLAARTLPEFAHCRPASVAPPVPPTLPGPADPPADDVERNRAFAIIAYLWILFVVGLIAAPGSRFAKYHSNQGLVLFLASIIAMVGCLVIGFIPFVNLMLVFLVPVLWVSWLVLIILGIVNAAGGQCKPLPLIGHFGLIK